MDLCIVSLVPYSSLGTHALACKVSGFDQD